MEKQIRSYLNSVNSYYSARNYLVFLMVFSLANIAIYYLQQVSWIRFIMDMLSWNSDLAPAASLPRILLIQQVQSGHLLTGILLAVGALLPYLLSWLLTINQKQQRFSGWGFLPALLWYVADTAQHLYYTVTILWTDFSLSYLLWEIVGVILRLVLFLTILDGMTSARKSRKQWKELMETVTQLHRQSEPETAEGMTEADYEIMTRRVVNQISNRVEQAKLQAYADSL